MANIIEITDFLAPELDLYARLMNDSYDERKEIDKQTIDCRDYSDSASTKYNNS